MKNLVVCCDGTWNTPDQQHDGVATPTNVYRFYNAVERSKKQKVYYHPGVGTEGNWWQKLAGGGFGLGLTKNITSGYKWLSDHYEDGDRIFLYGFSRGAYTVRSLAGMISFCGLVKPDADSGKSWDQAEKATDAYRKRQKKSKWARNMKFHGGGKKVKIHFLGVWDTVGALGIPNDLAILNLLDKFSNLSFHDTKLSTDVENARHAVAIDERRLPFSPTLWTGPGANRPEVKQVWFPGVHSDVGGGYAEIGLSNGALKWMIDESKTAKVGLKFQKNIVDQVIPDAHDVIHESFSGAVKGLKPRPRSIPHLTRGSSIVHESATDRITKPPIAYGRYRETILMKKGEKRTFDIFAVDPWNATDVFMKPNHKYKFTATGQWLDWHDRSGPDGLDDGKFQIGDIARTVGSALGLVERGFKKVFKNDEADIKFSKRHEGIDWFSLVGAIANGRLNNKGEVISHETIAIGKEKKSFTVKMGGYFYAYANDAWHMYDNNKGSVQLTIERLE